MNCNTIRLWSWDPNADHEAFLDACYNNGNKPIYVISGLWVGGDLSDPSVRQYYKDQFQIMVSRHKDHPAILMWAFGNEVNYTPYKAQFFTLLNEAAQLAHAEEGVFHHPVATANGEVSDIFAYNSSLPDLDVWGVNVYRGVSKKSGQKDMGNFFNEYASASAKPMVLTEFGIDALKNDAVPPQEYELVAPFTPEQANYDAAEWDQIRANQTICSGGCIMAYSDEWWKADYDSTHDNGGYPNTGPDHFSNEEWYGIMRTTKNGTPGQPDSMYPRAVYYVMQERWEDAPQPKMSSLTVPWFADQKK